MGGVRVRVRRERHRECEATREDCAGGDEKGAPHDGTLPSGLRDAWLLKVRVATIGSGEFADGISKRTYGPTVPLETQGTQW